MTSWFAFYLPGGLKAATRLAVSVCYIDLCEHWWGGVTSSLNFEQVVFFFSFSDSGFTLIRFGKYPTNIWTDLSRKCPIYIHMWVIVNMFPVICQTNPSLADADAVCGQICYISAQYFTLCSIALCKWEIILHWFIHWFIAGTHASFAQTVLYLFELGNLREGGRSMPMGPFLGEGKKHPFADVSMFSQVL